MMLSIVVGLFSGIAAALGLGGGFVLLVYLTAIAGVDQLQAQGTNLLFFLPIAIVSLILHFKNHLIEKKPLLPAILFGIVGVAAGAVLAFWIPTYWLQKLFAVLVLIVGVKELFRKKPQKDEEKSKPKKPSHST